MIITDHHRPKSWPTTFHTYASPRGSEAGVVGVFGRGDKLYAHRLGERAVQVGTYHGGWTIERAVAANSGAIIPPEATPIPRLYPFCPPYPHPISRFGHIDSHRQTVLDRPVPGRTGTDLVYDYFEVEHESRRMGGFTSPAVRTRGVPPAAVVAATEDAVVFGLLWPGLLQTETPALAPTTLRRSMSLAALTGERNGHGQGLQYEYGDSGHGVWFYRNGVVIRVPETNADAVVRRVSFPELAEVESDEPFPSAESPLPRPSVQLGGGFMILPRVAFRVGPSPSKVKLYAFSAQHAFRITFGGKNEVELVIERRKLSPYTKDVEVMDGWTIPVDLYHMNLQQTSVCAFISPDETTLMLYLPIYLGVSGDKQLLVRTVALDLE